MKIAIGTDHKGVALKKIIIGLIPEVTWLDQGTDSVERTDYPIYAKKVVESVLSGAAQGGVLLCGSGIGMSIAANRFKGIYAALAWSVETARLAKEHDNANILVIPADFVKAQEAVAMVRAWKEAVFLKERYYDRLKMCDSI